MNIEYGETPEAKHIHQIPEEVPPRGTLSERAQELSKKRRNSKRVAKFFKGARSGRGAIGAYDNCFRPPWGTDQN